VSRYPSYSIHRISLKFLSEEHMNDRFQRCIERLDDRTTLRTDDATWPNLADHHVIETRALSPAAAAM
jgi:hypothetical protein